MSARPLGAACALLLALLAAGCMQRPVTAADKALFVTVSDLAALGYQHASGEGSEEVTKTFQFPGNWVLEYKYKNEQRDKGHPLMLYVRVVIGRSESSARRMAKAGSFGESFVYGRHDIIEQELQTATRYGDDSHLVMLVKDGHKVGNTFRMRDGNKVYRVTLAGFCVDDAALWDRLVAAKLKALASYEP